MFNLSEVKDVQFSFMELWFVLLNFAVVEFPSPWLVNICQPCCWQSTISGVPNSSVKELENRQANVKSLGAIFTINLHFWQRKVDPQDYGPYRNVEIGEDRINEGILPFLLCCVTDRWMLNPWNSETADMVFDRTHEWTDMKGTYKKKK